MGREYSEVNKSEEIDLMEKQADKWNKLMQKHDRLKNKRAAQRAFLNYIKVVNKLAELRQGLI